MDYGFKVSKRGYDVKTAADVNLAFTSKYTTLKVFAAGSGNVDPDGGKLVLIHHGLEYVPVFFCHGEHVDGSGEYSWLPYYPHAEPTKEIVAYADNDFLYIEWDTGWGSCTLEYKYTIFRNEMAAS